MTRQFPKRDDRRDDRSLADLFNALPPSAVEAEMSLLGSIILDPDTCGDVVQVIRASEDFFRPAHAELWSAILHLYDTHQSVDVVQLQQLLEDRGSLERVGGLAYVVELADSVPSAANAVLRNVSGARRWFPALLNQREHCRSAKWHELA